MAKRQEVRNHPVTNPMKNIIFLMFLLFSFIIYAQEKKCADYKVGEFTDTNPNYTNWKVMRNETEQIETHEINRIELKASIIWISDCEYILTYMSFNNSKEHEIVGQKINVKIIKVTYNSVVCESEGLGHKLEL